MSASTHCMHRHSGMAKAPTQRAPCRLAAGSFLPHLVFPCMTMLSPAARAAGAGGQDHGHAPGDGQLGAAAAAAVARGAVREGGRGHPGARLTHPDKWEPHVCPCNLVSCLHRVSFSACGLLSVEETMQASLWLPYLPGFPFGIECGLSWQLTCASSVALMMRSDLCALPACWLADTKPLPRWLTRVSLGAQVLKQHNALPEGGSKA